MEKRCTEKDTTKIITHIIAVNPSVKVENVEKNNPISNQIKIVETVILQFIRTCCKKIIRLTRRDNEINNVEIYKTPRPKNGLKNMQVKKENKGKKRINNNIFYFIF